MFCGINGRFSPSSTQLAENTEYNASSIRRIIKRGLEEEVGCLVRVGSFPVLNAQGVARGSKIIEYSIPVCPLEATLGDPDRVRDPVPVSPKRGSSVSLRGNTLNSEVLNSDKREVFDSDKRNDPNECDHAPKDNEGYCTKCGTQVD